MRKFLVVYYWMCKHGYGYGNIVVTVGGSLNSDGIREIEAQIEKDYAYSKAVVLNIIELGNNTEAQ